MLARQSIRFLGALGVLAAVVFPIRADNDSSPAKGRISDEAAQCERLVAQLVNAEKPPFKKDFVLRLPKGVDEQTLRKKQAKIVAAYAALSDKIEVSLPILMKHIDDERFSFVCTSTSGAVIKKYVGEACADIVVAHVEVYRRQITRGDFAGVPRCPSFIYAECGGIEEWWKARQGKSLAALQLEGIEWIIRQQKPKEFESEKEWKAAKKSLEKMAEDIRASKKPIPVQHRPPRLVVYK